MSVRKAGRPVGGDSDARQKLIDACRPMFMRLPYEKVSTRMVAEKAGVNVALIRYYFQSKAGLFEAMVNDTMEPIHSTMSAVLDKGGFDNLEQLMRTYYKTMAPYPEFPALVARIMNGPADDTQRRILDKQFERFVRPMHETLFSKMPDLKEGCDPTFARLTFLSLMIFPFLIPRGFAELQGIEINAQLLNALADHNMQLLRQGMMKEESEVVS
ncbi:TetR/AcrR family transcriptional regulator [Thaumasiovibrio subtropicus]|uniref:TetR/AcrR family transcriptional regulator n=1 Tax=Thaumasiovibrio subtropicus TaxID=1891207 RepID=UPI000B352F6A|nr:TetR/AcrR family transcriptional regulator [Thaumasiovibrio subtropicus]